MHFVRLSQGALIATSKVSLPKVHEQQPDDTIESLPDLGLDWEIQSKENPK